MSILSNIKDKVIAGAKQLALGTKKTIDKYVESEGIPQFNLKTGKFEPKTKGENLLTAIDIASLGAGTAAKTSLKIGTPIVKSIAQQGTKQTASVALSKAASSSIDDILRGLSQGAKQSVVQSKPILTNSVTKAVTQTTSKIPNVISRATSAARPIITQALKTPSMGQALTAGGIIGGAALAANSIIQNTRNASTTPSPTFQTQQTSQGGQGGGFSINTEGVNLNETPEGAGGRSYQDIVQRAKEIAPMGDAGVSGSSSGQTFNGNVDNSLTTNTGGRSSFTGTLGAAGVGSSAIPYASSSLIGDTNDVAGSRLLDTQGNEIAPSSVDLSSPIQLSTGQTVKLADVNKALQDVNVLSQQLGSDSTSLPEFRDRIKFLMSAGMDNIKKLVQVPQTPVVETPAQQEFLSLLPQQEQYSMQQVMDGLRISAGLPELEQQRIQTMQQLQVTKDVYQKAIDDIKKNPDLPKNLAARRLSQVAEDQKFTITQLMGNLEMVEMQIDNANDLINQRFQIYEAEEERQVRAQSRMQENLRFIIESGAIAGMTNEEMNSWASATGYNVASLKALKQKSLMPTINPYFVENTDNAGNVTVSVFDKNNPQNGAISSTNLGAVGKASQTSAKGGAGSGTPQPKKLSVTDLQRLQQAYPEAGITFGDTDQVAEQKISLKQDQVDLDYAITTDGVRNLQQLQSLFPTLKTDYINSRLNALTQSVGKKKESWIDTAARSVNTAVDSFFARMFR
ncbi:MAG: hypothetical protein VW270_02090 [Candidatus Poseidoniales archaeon]